MIAGQSVMSPISGVGSRGAPGAGAPMKFLHILYTFQLVFILSIT